MVTVSIVRVALWYVVVLARVEWIIPQVVCKIKYCNKPGRKKNDGSIYSSLRTKYKVIDGKWQKGSTVSPSSVCVLDSVPARHCTLSPSAVNLRHKTNDRAGQWSKNNNFLLGPQELLLTHAKRPKLTQFRHVTRHNGLSKIILVHSGGRATPWSVKEMLNGFRIFTDFGPYVWNSLPQDIRQCSTLTSFKANLKTFLFSQYFHSS